MEVDEVRRRVEALTQALGHVDELGALALPARVGPIRDELRQVLRQALGGAIDEWLQLGGGLVLEAPEVEEEAPETEEVARRVIEVPSAEDPSDEDPSDEDPSDEDTIDTDPPPPAPPSAPVRPGSLSALQDFFRTAAVPDQAAVPSDAWLADLRLVIGRALPSDDPVTEQTRVVRAVAGCDGWTRFSGDVQQALAEALAMRLRSLQVDGYDDRSVRLAFSRLTSFVGQERPGFVYGLARDHTPRGTSWSSDADDAWDRLLALLPDQDGDEDPAPSALLARVEELADELELAPDAARAAVTVQLVAAVRAALEGGVSSRDRRLVRAVRSIHDDLKGREFRSLRRAIRDVISAEVEDDQTDAGHVLPDDWAWWNHTRGRRGILVGGSPREPNRRRIEETFAFGELTWERTLRKPQALPSLQNRIRQRSVDLVIILGAFVGHSYDDILLPACRDADVPWVHVDHGYGTVRIQQCIERFLDGGGAG